MPMNDEPNETESNERGSGKMGQDDRKNTGFSGQSAMLKNSVESYHLHDRNPCPNCAGLHWYIGRSTAECAYCGTALPLASISYGTSRRMILAQNAR